MNYIVQNSRIMNWVAYPLVRVVICFILGIFIGHKLQTINIINVLIFTLTASSVGLLIHKYTNGLVTNICSSLIFIVFIGLGTLRGLLENPENIRNHYTHLVTDGEDILVGQLTEEIQKKKSSYSTQLKVEQVNGEIASGQLLIYFNKSDSLLQYNVGDIIAIKGRVNKIMQTRNPKAFDYRLHLANKGIHRQVFLKGGRHNLVTNGRLWLPNHFANLARKWALGILKERIGSKEEYAIASAMVLGEKSSISDKLQKAFSETGAVHVLAVSGLHVGIVLMLFNFLFRRINKKSNKQLKVLKMVIMSMVVILYALITGASPAVVRSTIMFSTILFGKLYFDDVNIYNILALSALLILLYDPLNLFNLGFIFSYLALISIVFFQPIILKYSEKIYSTKTWLGYRIIQLVTVSLAAQILIFPMSIFYFHKFPVYFILSGVIAVAMAPFLLGAGLLTIALDCVPFLGDCIAMVFEYLLWSFLNVIYWIQALPFNSIRDMWVSQSSMILQYVIILSMMYFISQKKTGYQEFINPQNFDKRVAIKIICLGIIGLLVNSTLFDYRIKNHNELIVYDHRGSTFIDIYEGENLYTISSQETNGKNEMYTSRDYRIYNGSPSQHQLVLTDTVIHNTFASNGKGVVQYDNKVILFIGLVEEDHRIPCESDVLIISHNTETLPYRFLDRHTTKLVVLDQSLSYKIVNQWKKECDKRGLEYYMIRDKGPYIIKY